MNTDTASTQNPTGGEQVFFSVLFLFLLAGFGTLWVVTGFSHVQMLSVILGLVFFIISFISLRIGLVILAISMLFSPEISAGAVGSRPLTLRIEDVLIPILAVAWLAQVAVKRQWGVFSYTPLNLPILWVLFLSVFSTARGALAGIVPPLTGTFYVLKTVEFFFIFYLTLNYVKEEKQIMFYLFFVLLTGCVLGFYTIVQVPQVRMFTEHRITAPFEGSPEPATAGGYLLFLMMISLSIVLFEKRLFMKWFFTFFTGLLFVPFLYTLNRASYMAMIGGIIYLAIAARKKWFLVLVIGFLVTSPVWAPGPVRERIAFTWEDGKAPGRVLGVDYSLQERVFAFKKMYPTWKKSPLIGWGVMSWDMADSQWARTLHEVGIIGLLFWLWIFVRLYKIAWWLFKNQGEGLFKGMCMGYCAALIGLFFHGFGAITLCIVRIMEPFWFMSGLIVSLYLIEVRKTAAVK